MSPEAQKPAEQVKQTQGTPSGGPAKQPETAAPETAKTDSEVTGQSTTNVAETPETQAAERAGVSEGDIKALRDEAGVDGLAGHQANVVAWENSEEGKAFIKEAKKNSSDAEDAAKEAHKPLDSKGRTEAQKNYEEKVKG